MLCFGMPTLIEKPGIEDSARLCREVGFSFVEMNMNLPQYQIDGLDPAALEKTAKEFGIGYTIHLDETMNMADFNPYVAQAHLRTTLETIELAKKLQIPVLNMHLPLGVYFTLPERKVYLLEEYRRLYVDRAKWFRDACTAAIGDSDISICVENWSGYRLWQLPALDALLESDAFGLTFDVGHNFCKQGQDEPVILGRMEKLRHMHLHDVKDGNKDHQTLGSGELNISRYLSLASECQCRVVVETKTVAGLKASAQWLKDKDLL